MAVAVGPETVKQPCNIPEQAPNPSVATSARSVFCANSAPLANACERIAQASAPDPGRGAAQAAWPLLFIPAMSFHKILVAVDGQPVATQAADVAFELARSLGAKVALVHVLNPMLDYAPESYISPGELLAMAKQEGTALLDQLSQRSSLQPPPATFLREGSPSAEVVQVAREWAAELIIIGSHGRRGVVRALLGSVAEAVMRHAPCPVLVIKATQ